MNHTMPYNLSDLIWFPKASPNHGSPQPPAPRCQQAALASEETAFLLDISKFNSFRIPLKIPRFYSLITLHGHEKKCSQRSMLISKGPQAVNMWVSVYVSSKPGLQKNYKTKGRGINIDICTKRNVMPAILAQTGSVSWFLLGCCLNLCATRNKINPKNTTLNVILYIHYFPLIFGYTSQPGPQPTRPGDRVTF